MKSWALASRAAAIDLGLRGAGPPVGDVLGERAVEQHRLLLHDGDLPRAGYACVTSRMSWPSIRMWPASTS